MRASKRARNQRADTVRPLPTVTALPDDMKVDIAKAARGFTDTQIMGGTCVARALVGHKLLREIGLDAKLTYGAMLYRTGFDPMTDVVAYCGKYNTGYLDAFMIGHLWNELGDDLIDFSCGDWHRESEWQLQMQPDGLPPISWQVEPPQYMWQKAAPLKKAWRKIGQPALGEFWYGPWTGKLPDHTEMLWIVDTARGAVMHMAEEMRLRERVSELTK